MVATLAAIRETARRQKGAPGGQSRHSGKFVKTKLTRQASVEHVFNYEFLINDFGVFIGAMEII